ncbi:hypothetical protein AgCh_022475 [Apium graveolens]
MDWLSSNGAQIDYKGKKVKIRMPNGKEIVIKGQRQTQKFLNIVQAKKLLRKDSKAYLAYVAGKASVVADALSSKERLRMLTTPEELVRELEEMEIEVKSLEEKTNEERESLTENKSNVRKMRREL